VSDSPGRSSRASGSQERLGHHVDDDQHEDGRVGAGHEEDPVHLGVHLGRIRAHAPDEAPDTLGGGAENEETDREGGCEAEQAEDDPEVAPVPCGLADVVLTLAA
jgi:hypothetical protein